MEKIIFEDLPSTKTPINSSNLNKIQDNVEEAINGIIESGKNENGSWIKFPDGTMICKNTKQFSVSTQSTLGSNLYYGNIQNVGTFPIEFIERPDINFNVHNGSNIFAIQPFDFNSVTTTSAGGVYPISTANVNNVSIYISYIAIGKWK